MKSWCVAALGSLRACSCSAPPASLHCAPCPPPPPQFVQAFLAAAPSRPTRTLLYAHGGFYAGRYGGYYGGYGGYYGGYGSHPSE